MIPSRARPKQSSNRQERKRYCELVDERHEGESRTSPRGC